MAYLVGISLVALVTMWGPMIAARDNMADQSCPVSKVQVRYPEGMREAVCNPTGINWR